MDNIFRLHTAADYPLERGFRAIRRDFGYTRPLRPNRPKTMVLPRAPRHLTPFDPPGPEAAFSHFGFVADRRFRLTITGNSFPEGGNIMTSSLWMSYRPTWMPSWNSTTPKGRIKAKCAAAERPCKPCLMAKSSGTKSSDSLTKRTGKTSKRRELSDQV